MNQAPTLSEKDIGHLRHMARLANQLPGDWSGMGSDWWDIGEGAHQYELAFMAYTLGIVQHRFTPAYHDFCREAIAALIGKMMVPDIWQKWINASRGGKVEHVVYDDVCIRDTKNPILMDTHYSAAPNPNQDHIPLFTDIVLRNVRVEGAGKITLDGYDEAHRLGIAFDNVVLDDLKKIKFSSSHAVVQAGPGPVNFTPEGADVKVDGSAGKGAENSCQGKFVPMPSTAVGK